MSELLVFDGHDGCGKSTLAALVAADTGGLVVKPFADTLGDHIAWLWGNRRFDEADALARSSVERILARYDDRLLVFDRHWATMFTVLPGRLWDAWGTLPPTVICHADTDVVVRRLAERGEEVGDPATHDHYGRLYVELAARAPHAMTLDTGKHGLDECRRRVHEFLATRPALRVP